MPEIIITRPSYQLRVDTERPRAWLTGADSRLWSQLSLICSVDRVGADDETMPGVVVEQVGDRLLIHQPSSAWRHKTVVVECGEQQISIWVEVAGSGQITDVTLLGGRAVLPSGACGTFRSGIGFAGVWTPTPTQPVAVMREADTPAVLSVVGDAEPGRLHGIFSPPPLCFGLSRERPTSPTAIVDGDWLGVWLHGDVSEFGFTHVGYRPLDGGFLCDLDFQGHTTVDDNWTSPRLVLRPVTDPQELLASYVAAHPARLELPEPAWWRRPIFCGWGAQCARVAAQGRSQAAEGLVGGSTAVTAANLATQQNYDEWLALLDDHHLSPGTVVIDDKWAHHYGTAEPDLQKWPDLRGWIAAQHAVGRRVLLWWKAWDPEGLPAELCITTPDGRPVAVDPSNPAYLDRVRQIIANLLGPDGLDADGLKVDFTQRTPSGASLRAHSDGCWGVSALHALVGALHSAAKAVKPDALVITHTVHPGFAAVCDMVRLNDVLEVDARGNRVPVVDQLRFRAAVASATLPGVPIDTDQWPMPSRQEWLDYVTVQTDLGVPALYYLESIDNSGEQITSADLALVAQTWRQHQEGGRLG